MFKLKICNNEVKYSIINKIFLLTCTILYFIFIFCCCCIQGFETRGTEIMDCSITHEKLYDALAVKYLRVASEKLH